MTGEAPWMGVTPQPPSDSEPRVARVTDQADPDWGSAMIRAMVTRMIRTLEETEGLNVHDLALRIDLTLEVPWPDQSESH